MSLPWAFLTACTSVTRRCCAGWEKWQKQLDAVPSAVTFDQHPEDVILGGAASSVTSPADRADLMRRLFGIRDIIIAHFDSA